jgi:hypothetical protein
MAGVRRTVGVYDKPEKRAISPRLAVIAIVVAIAAASGAAAFFLL